MWPPLYTLPGRHPIFYPQSPSPARSRRFVFKELTASSAMDHSSWYRTEQVMIALRPSQIPSIPSELFVLTLIQWIKSTQPSGSDPCSIDIAAICRTRTHSGESAVVS